MTHSFPIRRSSDLNKSANGGGSFRELHRPDFRYCDVDNPYRGSSHEGNVHALAPYLRDVAKQNNTPRNFRIFGPDELVSNRLEDVFESTKDRKSTRLNSIH